MEISNNWEYRRCVVATLMEQIGTAIHFAMDIDKGATFERAKHNEPILDIYFPTKYFEYCGSNPQSLDYELKMTDGFHIVVYDKSIVVTRIINDAEEKSVTIPKRSEHQQDDRIMAGDMYRFFGHHVTHEIFLTNGDLSNSDLELLFSLSGKLYPEHLLLLFTFIGDNELVRFSTLKILLGFITNYWNHRPEEKMVEWKDPLDALFEKTEKAYPSPDTNSTEQSSKKIMKYHYEYERIFDNLNDILIAFVECGLTDYDIFVEYIDKELIYEDLKYLDSKPSYYQDERPINFLKECLKRYKE